MMMMFSTPKAKPMMAYSSLTAQPSPATLPSKSLLSYLSVLDEEASSSESGSPSSFILLDESSRSNNGNIDSSSSSNNKSGDMQQKDDESLRDRLGINSPTANTTHRQHQQQRRTTDFFRRPVCSLQALSRSAKKKTPSSRMTFTSPNILRGGGLRMAHKQRAHTERANKKRSSRRSSVGTAAGDTASQKMELTHVKLEMMSMHLQTKNEEVTNLKALLAQSESKVEALESKVSTLEEELNQSQLQQKEQEQQQHLNVPLSILEVQSLGSNSEYDTEHDSQTMSDTIPEELLKQLHDAQAREVAVLNHCDVLEDQTECWQREANEWKRRYELLMEEQQQKQEEEDAESGGEESATANTSINISFSNDDHGSQGSPFVERHSHTCSITDSVSDNMSMSDENKTPTLDDAHYSNKETSSPPPAAAAAVTKGYGTSSRTPLGNSAIQNNLLTPVVNTTTKKRGGNRRHRKKTNRLGFPNSPATIVNKAKGVTSSRKSSHSGTTTATNNISSSSDVQFGDVGWKFRKWFGSRYGNYDGLVKEICPDGTRHCVYEADPEGDEYLTLEELGKTKSLMKEAVNTLGDTDATRNENMKTSRNDKGNAEGVLQVKKNVTCHIW